MVLKLLAESVCQPREAPHPHSHRKVLPLNVTGRNVLRIRIAAQDTRLHEPSRKVRVLDYVSAPHPVLCCTVRRPIFPRYPHQIPRSVETSTGHVEPLVPTEMTVP